MRLTHKVTSLVPHFALLLTLSSPGHCAQIQPDPCATSSQPGDISVQLSLKNGQTVFREGEIIALVAEYSSAAQKKYYLSTRNYDRSGRLEGMEVFCIDPAKATDPLSDYFNGIMGSFGGGLGGEEDLSDKPYDVNLELNEWKSLPPGSYRVSIVSYRLTVASEDSPHESSGRSIPLRSNEVQFEVVNADPGWQHEQLSAAERALDSADPGGEDAKHAARVLRFLGSEEATRELARRFWSGNEQPFGWDLKFGLFGSPCRAAAIAGMKTALTDSQHPVTQEFVQTLAILETQSDPKSRLPKYDENDEEAWIKARDAYQAAFDKEVSDQMSKVAAALQDKAGAARAVTVSELLQSDLPLDAAARSQLRQMLLTSWGSLPVRRQNELIQYRWEQVGGPEWLSVLRTIVDGEPNRNREMDKLDRAPALRRIYEISPDQGHGLILREIVSPKGDIGIDVLGLLPEPELPQIEQRIVAKLKTGNGNDLDFQLLERYASRRAFPEVRSLYEVHRGEWACVPQTALLRYFLRVEPGYGTAQVRDAIGQRKATGCYKFQLTGLGEQIREPKIEQLAIESLNDPSVEVVQNAAEALGRFGSQKSEGALWTRLEKFHAHWKDRTDELHYRPGMQSDIQKEVRLEQVLVQALVDGQAWLATEDTIHKLKDIASLQMQQELDGVLAEIERGEYSLNLNWWPEGTLNYSIGRYTGKGMIALREKLAEFPAGTHLDLITTVAERNLHPSEFAEVESAAIRDGLVLKTQTPR
jgi:hypothetical protein